MILVTGATGHGANRRLQVGVTRPRRSFLPFNPAFEQIFPLPPAELCSLQTASGHEAAGDAAPFATRKWNG